MGPVQPLNPQGKELISWGAVKLNNENIAGEAHTRPCRGAGGRLGAEHVVVILRKQKPSAIWMERLEQRQERLQQHPGSAWICVCAVPSPQPAGVLTDFRRDKSM